MPVDETFAYSELKKGRDPNKHFGGHPGDFIVMHENLGLAPKGCLDGNGKQWKFPMSQFALASYSGPCAYNPKAEHVWKVNVLKRTDS